MKRSLKFLLDFRVKATDGELGQVVDFLFDEKKWIIRYLKVDLGLLLGGKIKLIGRTFLDKPKWEELTFPVTITQVDILDSPNADEHLPVSLQYEEELHKHFHIENYWDLPVTPVGMLYPLRPLKVPIRQIHENDIKTNLRSYNEVENYHVHAKDGMFGHICDLIVDDEDWQVVYAIIDTSNWMPWSRKVVIPISKLDEISYVNQEISINLSIESIKNSPEYRGIATFKTEYEMLLHEFYTKAL